LSDAVPRRAQARHHTQCASSDIPEEHRLLAEGMDHAGHLEVRVDFALNDAQDPAFLQLI
jgi:hypothetical protein